MTETIITVRGEHTARHAAERAVVRAGIQFDGPKRDDVFARAVASADTVRASIEPLVDAAAGPVTQWSSQSVRVWSHRPWNADGKQLALVYSAAVDFSVTFADTEALARWVEATAAVAGATIGGIHWELTDETRRTLTTEVQSLAVADAVARATVFAAAVGLGSVTAVALADPGMLGDPGSGGGGGPFAASPAAYRSMKAADAGAPELAFTPEDIEVTVAVDARFAARS